MRVRLFTKNGKRKETADVGYKNNKFILQCGEFKNLWKNQEDFDSYFKGILWSDYWVYDSILKCMYL